jgi:Short C-terminal domain
MRGRRGRPGLLGTMARTTVIAGTASAVSGRVAHSQQQRFAAQEQAQAPPPAPAAAPAPAPAQPDVIEQLKQLAALQQQGILTEAEFAAKKAQLLGI